MLAECISDPSELLSSRMAEHILVCILSHNI